MLILKLLLISSAYALEPQLQQQITAYISFRHPAEDPAQKTVKESLDRIETRLLPLILNLNRLNPVLAQRNGELDSLKTFVDGHKELSSPYKDTAWVDKIRGESMRICCAIRRDTGLAAAIQENVAEGKPALTPEVAEKLAHAADSSPMSSGGTAAFLRMTSKKNERPSKANDDEVKPYDSKRQGLISGLPDLDEPKAPPKAAAPSNGGGSLPPTAPAPGGASAPPPPAPKSP